MSRVLFVCLHNAGRSQISRALFERAAEGRHSAESAGSVADPDGSVHPEVVAVMQEIGIDLSGRRPQRLSEELASRGHHIVRIGSAEPVKRPLIARPFDIVHVHEPFAPSVSAAALRHSLSLNVATFHAPQERVLSTQVARPLVEIFFGRIDARTVTTTATAELLGRYFPADYELVEPAGGARDQSDLAADVETWRRAVEICRHRLPVRDGPGSPRPTRPSARGRRYGPSATARCSSDRPCRGRDRCCCRTGSSDSSGRSRRCCCRA